MVLRQLSVPGRPTKWMKVGQVVVGADGVVWAFLSFIISLSLCETA